MKVTINGVVRTARPGTMGMVLLTNGTELEGIISPTGRIYWCDGAAPEHVDGDGEPEMERDRRLSHRTRYGVTVLFMVMLTAMTAACTSPMQPTSLVEAMHPVWHQCGEVWTNVWPCSAYGPSTH